MKQVGHNLLPAVMQVNGYFYTHLYFVNIAIVVVEKDAEFLFRIPLQSADLQFESMQWHKQIVYTYFFVWTLCVENILFLNNLFRAETLQNW